MDDGARVPLTDIGDPNYFHKVVDCQWACPAHTPVPEYIRLIADGRYDDAYMINWKSNVFPGILGRTCDRPCEPACRRGRVEKEPVAICRLKRVTADYKDDIRDRLPVQGAANGKRVAMVGGGPPRSPLHATCCPWVTNASSMMATAQAGGMIRSQIPKFRLPESVIDEEVGYILNLGAVTRLGEYVGSMKASARRTTTTRSSLAAARRAAAIWTCRAARKHRANIHIGIDWLSSVSFGHVTRIGKRVIVLGGGNTAMDCCRSSRRLGGDSVTVVVRSSGFEEMKASPWEKEDAMHEDIPILNYHVPKSVSA